jgi:hypothetical protein
LARLDVLLERMNANMETASASLLHDSNGGDQQKADLNTAGAYRLVDRVEIPGGASRKPPTVDIGKDLSFALVRLCVSPT